MKCFLLRHHCFISLFYIKPQLVGLLLPLLQDCFISLFYIKPQQVILDDSAGFNCFISLFYIKPQPEIPWWSNFVIALYLFSTSNHNLLPTGSSGLAIALYLFSTSNHNLFSVCAEPCRLLYISFLHQTTTALRFSRKESNCFISLFYIKPQRWCSLVFLIVIALYLFSTSNHNSPGPRVRNCLIALYLFSTSNHNFAAVRNP